jgi:large subunit ribosomal protein L15
MPLHMRLPKRGFRNNFANDFSIVNLARIQKAIDEKRLDASQKITAAELRKAGLVHKSRDGVRVLGDGRISAALNLEVAGASETARDAVEKAGGTLVTTFVKIRRPNRKGEAGKRMLRRDKAAEKRKSRRSS